MGSSGPSAAKPVPCGTFISNTMIVMMTAFTPSLFEKMAPAQQYL